MQRRAAAVLIGLFLLTAMGAYALVAPTTALQITIAAPAVELTAGGDVITSRIHMSIISLIGL